MKLPLSTVARRETYHRIRYPDILLSGDARDGEIRGHQVDARHETEELNVRQFGPVVRDLIAWRALWFKPVWSARTQTVWRSGIRK